MNLYFRLIYLLLKGFFKPSSRQNITDTTSLNLIVLPNDLDLNWHMNNGRYLTIMDLGRIDFMQKIGLLNKIIKNKWFPVLSSSQMTFLRPLKLFQKYTLHTQLEYWDEKWYVITQVFESQEKIYAIGKVRGLFRDKEGTVSCDRILGLIDTGDPISPPLTAETKQWIECMEKITDAHLKSKAKPK